MMKEYKVSIPIYRNLSNRFKRFIENFNPGDNCYSLHVGNKLVFVSNTTIVSKKRVSIPDSVVLGSQNQDEDFKKDAKFYDIF